LKLRRGVVPINKTLEGMGARPGGKNPRNTSMSERTAEKIGRSEKKSIGLRKKRLKPQRGKTIGTTGRDLSPRENYGKHLARSNGWKKKSEGGRVGGVDDSREILRLGQGTIRGV